MTEEPTAKKSSPYPSGDPRRRRVRKGLERIQEAAAKLVAEGMDPEEAKQVATDEQLLEEIT